MQARCQRLDLSTGGHRTVFMSEQMLDDMDISPMDRVEVSSVTEMGRKAKDMVRRNELLLNVHAASEERRAMVYEHLSRNRIYTVD